MTAYCLIPFLVSDGLLFHLLQRAAECRFHVARFRGSDQHVATTRDFNFSDFAVLVFGEDYVRTCTAIGNAIDPDHTGFG